MTCHHPLFNTLLAARYFEVEEKYVYCTDTRFVLDAEEAVDLVDENTIGICVILGSTYTGHYEDVKAVNDLLVKKKIDCPIHVDAASGGFVAPFVIPDLEWDFRLDKVVSINVSGHKYGLVSLERYRVQRRSAEIIISRSIRVSDGLSGVVRNTCPKSWSSTSITSALIKPLSLSTSPKEHLR